MLDFNHRPKISEKINLLIDKALTAEHSKQNSRDYLGASRLGVSCNRALQFEYTDTPKDEDQNFTGRTLKIFQAGHVFEELMIKWLRLAGINLITQKQNGNQFGFAVAGGKVKGHIDGVIVDAPEDLDFKFPMLWECKSLNDKSWKETQKKVSLFQSQSMRHKSQSIRLTWKIRLKAFAKILHSSPQSTKIPPKFILN